MKSFREYNPLALVYYFAAILLTVVFSMNPIIICTALVGALLCCICQKSIKSVGTYLFFAAVIAVSALINPMFYHNGVTVLFVMNNNPVTLEALLYGTFSGAMIAAVLLIFGTFSHIFTSDKLQYVFGMLSNKAALLMSMTLRFIPLFSRQTRKVNSSQKSMGLYREDNIVDTVKGGANVFSIMTTWALENGIITADSMAARGYGTGRRSFYARYRFGKADIALVVIVTILFAVVTGAVYTNRIDFTYYPAMLWGKTDIWSAAAYISYAILVLIPGIIETGGSLRWKYLTSRI